MKLTYISKMATNNSCCVDKNLFSSSGGMHSVECSLVTKDLIVCHSKYYFAFTAAVSAQLDRASFSFSRHIARPGDAAPTPLSPILIGPP